MLATLRGIRMLFSAWHRSTDALSHPPSFRFHYQKTPGAVVTSKGYVAFVSDECYLVVLPNPDSATAASFWTTPVFVDNRSGVLG